jgi:hypothetical protein
MAYKLEKKYPENYSKDIINIINDLTLSSGQRPFLQGSGKLKLNYPSDYDLAQKIKINKSIKSNFQAVIRKLLKRKNVFIGDIKSGEIPELKVVPADTTERNYNERRPEMIRKLNDFYKSGFIDKEELDESLKLLRPNLTDMDMAVIKHDIRYEVIRWRPQDILAGHITYRKHKVDFNTYLFGDNTTKIDVITWVNGVRYSECTMIYFFLDEKGIPTNSMASNFELTIKNEIPYLLYKGRYLKICKRMNNLEMISKNPDDDLLRKFYNLFNSDLSLLNQVIGDIDILMFLIDSVKIIPKERFEYEIDQMKYRLGNMTDIKYLKQESITVRLLDELEKDVVNIDKMEKLKTSLNTILQGEVYLIMKHWRLLPVPSKYLPIGFRTRDGANKDRYNELLLGGKELLVKIPEKEFIKEHKHLIPLLTKGTKAQRAKEAQDQSAELKTILNK